MPTSGGNNCNCDSQNGGGRKRKPTKYNLYMKLQICELMFVLSYFIFFSCYIKYNFQI